MFETDRATQRPLAVTVQRDPRADGGKREVRLTRRDIIISRSLAGISMKIAIPVAAYRGVTLTVEPASNGGAAYRLSLTHRDPDLHFVLVENKG